MLAQMYQCTDLSCPLFGPPDWHQRKQLFSLYDDAPIIMDETGWYSVTPEAIAVHTAERCRSDTILGELKAIGWSLI